MNYFTQKYPYEERQSNLTTRRKKGRMRKKPKRIKKGGVLFRDAKELPSSSTFQLLPYNAYSMDHRDPDPYDQTQFPQSNLTASKRDAVIRETRRLQAERLRAQQAEARDAREAARASLRARAREREMLQERRRNKRQITAEERTRKRKPGRREQYEDMLLQDMNREIQRPVRFDQLERRIPYKPVRHTPDPRGEKDYLRPFPYELDIYGITHFSKHRAPIPGEYLTTRLDIPSEAGPYLEVGFKVPKNYEPSKKRMVKLEVTPLKGISYNYYNQAKFQTKKLLQKGYQKHKDRKNL